MTLIGNVINESFAGLHANSGFLWVGYSCGKVIPVVRLFLWLGYSCGKVIPVARLFLWLGYYCG